MYLWTSWTLHLQLGTSKLYLEPLLKTFETPGAFIWNPYLEPWNLPKLYLRTFAGNLDRHLEPSRTYTLTWMEPIRFTWNLGIFRNLYLEPLLGTSEPSGTLYDWNPYLEPRNLPEPLLGTLILGTSEPSEPYLEPLLGTSEPAGTFTWNPYTWNLGTFGTLLGTLTWNLGTCRNLYLEPLLGTSEPAGTFTWNPYLEPRSPPEPLLGTLTWNLGTCRNLYLLGTCRNLYLEPLLGTSEPARTWRDDCPRVPQGLVWLGPQSFQLLGKNKDPKTVIFLDFSFDPWAHLDIRICSSQRSRLHLHLLCTLQSHFVQVFQPLGLVPKEALRWVSTSEHPTECMMCMWLHGPYQLYFDSWLPLNIPILFVSPIFLVLLHNETLRSACSIHIPPPFSQFFNACCLDLLSIVAIKDISLVDS